MWTRVEGMVGGVLLQSARRYPAPQRPVPAPPAAQCNPAAAAEWPGHFLLRWGQGEGVWEGAAQQRQQQQRAQWQWQWGGPGAPWARQWRCTQRAAVHALGGRLCAVRAACLCPGCCSLCCSKGQRGHSKAGAGGGDHGCCCAAAAAAAAALPQAGPTSQQRQPSSSSSGHSWLPGGPQRFPALLFSPHWH